MPEDEQGCIPVPKPVREGNRCKLEPLKPEMPKIALYVGFFGSGQPLQVAYFGRSQFPFPEAPLAGLAGPIYGPFPGSMGVGFAACVRGREAVGRSNLQGVFDDAKRERVRRGAMLVSGCAGVVAPAGSWPNSKP
jgi:hypothetical protein